MYSMALFDSGLSVSVKNLIRLYSTRVSTFRFEKLKGPLTFVPGEVFEMVFTFLLL